MYVPPLIFDRNAHLVPRLVRVADLIWAGAGLSGHYRTSTICPPTSVYSLPLSLVDLIGGWDTDESSIGEDLHMYLKCFFKLNGNLTTRSIYSPASHSNVHTSGKGIRGFFQDILARYRQAMRHMWGALDSGYALKSLLNICWKTKTGQKCVIPFSKHPIVTDYFFQSSLGKHLCSLSPHVRSPLPPHPYQLPNLCQQFIHTVDAHYADPNSVTTCPRLDRLLASGLFRPLPILLLPLRKLPLYLRLLPRN